jgi:uncharacterized protein
MENLTNRYHEQEVTIAPRDVGQLAGTIAIPSGNRTGLPAVVIVAGSGPIDRDGTAGGKVALNLYRDLARFIASQGFVTLRYDKRGVGRSAGDYWRTGMWDLVSDLGAWTCWLQQHPQVDAERVALLGHSEGCMLITAHAARNATAGLVMLAGGGETVPEAVARQRQIAYAEAKASRGLQGALARLLRIDQLGERQAAKLMARLRSSDKDTLRIQFVRMNAKWYREHFAYDLLSDLSRLTCPVLAVTGAADLQADAGKLERLAGRVQGDLTCRIVEGMDHGLKEDVNGSILRIKDSIKRWPTQPLHPELAVVLSEWLSDWAALDEAPSSSKSRSAE